MQAVVKMDRFCKAKIQYPCHGLPEDLNHINAAEFAIPLCDQYEGMKGSLLRKVTLIEIRLYQANKHLLFRGV